MGLPSGTMWASRNIDVSQSDGFAASAIQLDASYFSWGNIDGHNANEGSFSPYDWGAGNDQEPYSSSPGATITYPGSLDIAHDCARVVCGAPWTVPDDSDYFELINNCDYIDTDGVVISGNDKIITIDGVAGIRMRSKINGNILFFAACGYGEGSSLTRGNAVGMYWSGSLQSSDNATCFFFNNQSSPHRASTPRYRGCTVRPIFRI